MDGWMYLIDPKLGSDSAAVATIKSSHTKNKRMILFTLQQFGDEQCLQMYVQRVLSKVTYVQ